MTTWQPCLLQGDKIMGEIVEYDFIILPLDFYVFLWKYRDSTRTRWNSQVGNIVEIIYPSPPLFFSGYKILSGSISKFSQWSFFGMRSSTTVCFRRVWEKGSRPLELKGFGNLNYEVSLERMI